MSTTAWVIVGCTLAVCAVILLHAVIVAPTIDDPGPPFVGTPEPLTFDEHAATAAALLQPDAPILSPDQEAVLLHGDQVADEAAQYLRNLTPGES
ncbi:hypothetical protein FJK98_02245 [Micromonospora sp. HM134]|uniref:hypothetical protein n=1 Tax=Micromonospora sp. HM134 TaxID=2583243 RepID=UPI001198C794|nr:hypothetical protein [Micromonospora sp. HM134]QDY06125.1 hypothetical protein FJK98_02245 [Micromonospora sp. HM134]